MSAGERPLPNVDDPLYAPFWDSAAQHRIDMQRCDACGFVRWPPRPLCPECLVPGGTWTTLRPTGTVWSYATYEHAYHPAFVEELPYTCALVELEDGPRLVTRIEAADGRELEIGQRVTASYVEVADGITLVYFAPAGDQGEAR